MSRAARSTRPYARPLEPEPWPSHWEWVTRLGLLLTLALVMCRALMSDSIREPVPPTPHSQAVPLAPGPATGLALDLLCCLPALLVLTRRAFDRNFRLIHSWGFVPMLLLGVMAIASVRWSADRFAAVVSASHLLCALILLWSTAQLLRSWLRLRWIGAVCFALLISLSITGYYYRLADFRDLEHDWQQNKAQILSEHNLQPGSYEAGMFEKRLLAGEPMGFSTSTNTYAALLVLLGVCTAGLVIQRVADRDSLNWSVLPIIVIGSAVPLIYWTQCRAAFVTPVLSAIFLVAIAILRPWLKSLARPLFFLAVLLLIGATGLVIQHGMRYGTLWHVSLSFRWNYWVGSYRVLTEDLPSHHFQQLFLGVGWENFGPRYLAHRLVTAAEEIRDPHNFIIRVFVELGLVGGLLLVIWMLKLWWDMTRPIELAASAYAPSTRLAATGVICTAFIAITINIILSVDFTSQGAYVFLEVIRRLVFFGAILIALAIGTFRGIATRPVDASDKDLLFEPDARPAPWILRAILVALGTFLIHNLIEFSLFETGPMFLFALLVGSCQGIRLEAAQVQSQVSQPSIVNRAVLSISAIAWVAAIITLVVPIAIAEGDAHDADDLVRAGQLARASAEMRRAFSQVPCNADYALRAANDLASAGNAPEQAKRLYDAAIATDPSSVSAHLARAQFLLSQPRPDIESAMQDYRAALALDPRNVRLRIEYADRLATFSRSLNRPQYRSEALLNYQRALDLDRQQHPDEPKRLTAAELGKVRTAIKMLERSERSALSTEPSTAH